METLIAIVYRPQEKNMQIILNTLWIFIIIHNLCMETFQSARYGAHEQLMHIYLFGVSIKRMLISQLKRFLGVKFMFPHRFNI